MDGSEAAPDHRLTIAVEPRPGEWYVALEGELTLTTARDLTETLERLLADAAASRPTVVVDLAGVTFLDSTGLNAIVRADLSASRKGRSLELLPGPADIGRIFELTVTGQQLKFRHEPD
jgi:anti-anti-sigma factor